MKTSAILMLTLLSLSSTQVCAAQEKKEKGKLILGAGIATTHINDYIGSDESRTYVLPVPFVYYKTDKFTLDRNAFQGELFSSDKWHLTLDASGSIPVKSEDNKARKGMEDLDWVGELGPSLEYYLIGESKKKNKAYLDLSVRKAVASDFRSFGDVGWTTELAIKQRQEWYSTALDGEITLSTVFALRGVTAKYSDYYYGVSREYETEERSTYEGKSGYAGAKISIGATWRKKNLWIGAFTRYTNIEKSIFDDSPLVKTNHNLLAGVVVSYIFKEN